MKQAHNCCFLLVEWKETIRRGSLSQWIIRMAVLCLSAAAQVPMY